MPETPKQFCSEHTSSLFSEERRGTPGLINISVLAEQGEQQGEFQETYGYLCTISTIKSIVR